MLYFLVLLPFKQSFQASLSRFGSTNGRCCRTCHRHPTASPDSAVLLHFVCFNLAVAAEKTNWLRRDSGAATRPDCSGRGSSLCVSRHFFFPHLPLKGSQRPTPRPVATSGVAVPDDCGLNVLKLFRLRQLLPLLLLCHFIK